MTERTKRTIDEEVVSDGFQLFFAIRVALAPFDVSKAAMCVSQRAKSVSVCERSM